MQKENYLRELSIRDFIERLDHYYAELNMLHPFLEGNGRATRVFLIGLGWQAGYEIDFSRIDYTDLVAASIRSCVDSGAFVSLLTQCVHPLPRNK